MGKLRRFVFSFTCSCKAFSVSITGSWSTRHTSINLDISPFIKGNIKAAFMTLKCFHFLIAWGVPLKNCGFIQVQTKMFCFFAFRGKFYFEESKISCCLGMEWTSWKVVDLKGQFHNFLNFKLENHVLLLGSILSLSITDQWT